MPKIPVNFEASHTSDEVLPIPVGRFYVGGYAVRVVFTPAGRVMLIVPRQAIDDGVVLIDDSALAYPTINIGIGETK